MSQDDDDDGQQYQFAQDPYAELSEFKFESDGGGGGGSGSSSTHKQKETQETQDPSTPETQEPPLDRSPSPPLSPIPVIKPEPSTKKKQNKPGRRVVIEINSDDEVEEVRKVVSDTGPPPLEPGTQHQQYYYKSVLHHTNSTGVYRPPPSPLLPLPSSPSPVPHRIVDDIHDIDDDVIVQGQRNAIVNSRGRSKRFKTIHLSPPSSPPTAPHRPPSPSTVITPPAKRIPLVPPKPKRKVNLFEFDKPSNDNTSRTKQLQQWDQRMKQRSRSRQSEFKRRIQTEAEESRLDKELEEKKAEEAEIIRTNSILHHDDIIEYDDADDDDDDDNNKKKKKQQQNRHHLHSLLFLEDKRAAPVDPYLHLFGNQIPNAITALSIARKNLTSVNSNTTNNNNSSSGSSSSSSSSTTKGRMRLPDISGFNMTTDLLSSFPLYNSTSSPSASSSISSSSTSSSTTTQQISCSPPRSRHIPATDRRARIHIIAPLHHWDVPSQLCAPGARCGIRGFTYKNDLWVCTVDVADAAATISERKPALAHRYVHYVQQFREQVHDGSSRGNNLACLPLKVLIANPGSLPTKDLRMIRLANICKWLSETHQRLLAQPPSTPAIQLSPSPSSIVEALATTTTTTTPLPISSSSSLSSLSSVQESPPPSTPSSHERKQSTMASPIRMVPVPVPMNSRDYGPIVAHKAAPGLYPSNIHDMLRQLPHDKAHVIVPCRLQRGKRSWVIYSLANNSTPPDEEKQPIQPSLSSSSASSSSSSSSSSSQPDEGHEKENENEKTIPIINKRPRTQTMDVALIIDG